MDSKYKSACNRYNGNSGSKQLPTVLKNWQEINKTGYQTKFVSR